MSVTSLLCVNDILHHIVSHIAADIEVRPTLESCFPSSPFNLRSNAARRTLARLARVHSDSTQPALAALWRFLPNDEALKRLLWVIRIDGSAQSLAEELQNTRNDPPLESHGTATTHGPAWIRFQEYASLVRAITIDPSVQTFEFPSKLIQGTFWSRISSTLGDTPILPRLEAVTLLNPNSFRVFDFDMGMLCPPNSDMRELNVIFPGVTRSRREQSNFRKVLSSCLPSDHNLEALSVAVPVPVLDMEPLPQSYPRLRHLKLVDDGIHPNHLALLATLPNLESLSIILNDSTPLHIPVTFAELRSLEVFGDAFVGIGLLIAHLDAPQLRSLSISEADPIFFKSFPQELPSHLRTLVKKCPFLSAFHWLSRDPSFSGPGESTSVGTALAEFLDSLLSLRAMRSF